MNTHIIKEEFKEKGYLKVTCSEGHYLTNWDKEDILNYTDAKIMYCPLNINLDNFYCITEEEHNSYMAQQEIAFRLREDNKLENIE